MNVLFQREKVSGLWDEVSPLITRHFRELSAFPDIPLQPRVDKYNRAEHDGILRTYTARDPYGELIGYAVFIVQYNMHYSSSLQAIQDVLYVTPELRNGNIGSRLITYAEGELKNDGVQLVYHHVKVKHNFGPLLERMGYQLNEYIYVKRLDEPEQES